MECGDVIVVVPVPVRSTGDLYSTRAIDNEFLSCFDSGGSSVLRRRRRLSI